MRKTTLLLACGALLLAVSCDKEDDPVINTSPGPRLVFNFQFDSTQTRLDNLGQPVSVPVGHAAQSPRFNSISGHYIEMTESMFVLPGDGEVLYLGPETDAGGDMAVDFDQANVVAEGEDFFSIPLSQVTSGSYEWLRVSLTYQNFEIDLRALGFDLTATVASFVGYNSYITDHVVKDSTITVNANRLQGYWAVETAFNVVSGQAPPGATTVPNPIFANSPIPQGSCLVTGQFPNDLVITGNETEDIVVTISVSSNDSFEWIDNGNGIYEPLDGDLVVDMGLRGLVPIVN